MFFELLKTFQIIVIRLRCFRLQKCYFGIWAVKYKQSDFSKNADTVLYIVKYENLIIGVIKRNTSDMELWKGKTNVRKQGVRSLYLFEVAQ